MKNGLKPLEQNRAIKMKKILIILLFLSNCLIAQMSGDGSSGNPYKISSQAGFDSIKTNSTLATSGYYFRMKNDIDLSGLSSTWFISNFYGHIDGNNHTLRNFTKDSQAQLYFIATFQGGSFKNIKIRNWNQSWIGTVTNGSFGMLFGLLDGTYPKVEIENVDIDSCTYYWKSTFSSSDIRAFGIVSGQTYLLNNNIIMKRIKIGENVVVTYWDYSTTTAVRNFGAFCGYLSGSGKFSLEESSVKATLRYQIGNATTNQVISNNRRAGSLLGRLVSLAQGRVQIQNNYSKVKWVNDLAGSVERASFIGSIGSNTTDTNYCFIKKNYAVDTVLSDVIKLVSIMWIDWTLSPTDTITNNYFGISKVSAGGWSLYGSQTSTTPTGMNSKIDSDMKIQSTFQKYDFDNIWDIHTDVNAGYPFLRWSDAAPVASNVISIRALKINNRIRLFNGRKAVKSF